jgi:hypothetical protein
MDPADRDLLQATYDLTEENNEILRKMRRGQVISRNLKIVYWVLIVGAGVGLFYYLDPYISQALTTYAKIKADLVRLLP